MATATRRPTSDAGPNDWTLTGASDHHSAIDESTPDDADYLSTIDDDDYEEFGFATISGISSCTKVVVHVRVKGIDGKYGLPILYVNLKMGSWRTEQSIGATTSFVDRAFTFNGSWSQSDLDGMEVRLLRKTGAPYGGGLLTVSQMYAVVTYTLSQNYDETGKSEVVSIVQACGDALTADERGSADTLSVAQALADSYYLGETGRLQTLLLSGAFEGGAMVHSELDLTSALLLAQAQSSAQAMVENARSQTVLIMGAAGSELCLGEMDLAEVLLVVQCLGEVFIPGPAVYDETGKLQCLLLCQIPGDTGVFSDSRSQVLLLEHALADGLVVEDSLAQSVIIVQAGTGRLNATASPEQALLIAQMGSARSWLNEAGSQVLLISLEGRAGEAFLETRQQSLLITQSVSQLLTAQGAVAHMLKIAVAESDLAGLVEFGPSQTLLIMQSERDWYPTYWNVLARLPADALAAAHLPLPSEVTVRLPKS